MFHFKYNRYKNVYGTIVKSIGDCERDNHFTLIRGDNRFLSGSRTSADAPGGHALELVPLALTLALPRRR